MVVVVVVEFVFGQFGAVRRASLPLEARWWAEIGGAYLHYKATGHIVAMILRNKSHFALETVVEAVVVVVVEDVVAVVVGLCSEFGIQCDI